MLYELLHECQNMKSLETPFLNRRTHLGKIFILHLGKEIPLLENYTSWQCPPLEYEGEIYGLNFDEGYLRFLDINAQKSPYILTH